MNEIKLNIGSGRLLFPGFTNIDIVGFIDGNGKEIVDKIMDIEKEPLPYKDKEVSEIKIDNVLEHIGELRFVMNECHRVLKDGGVMRGVVPVAGTRVDFKDPTHKRHFIWETFDYFTGTNPANTALPGHPKYADYGFKPWYMVRIIQSVDDLIYFEMTPRC